MPEPEQVSPLAFWGVIQAAVRERAPTAEVWRAIRERASEAGWSLPRGMFGEVNRMRSLAASLRTSAEQLARARPEDAITGPMVGRLPYARPAESQAVLPAWHARLELRVVRAGVETSEWLTLQWQGALPATVGALREQSIGMAAALVEGYNAELVDVTSIELGAW